MWQTAQSTSCAGCRVISHFQVTAFDCTAKVHEGTHLANSKEKKVEYHIYEQFKRSQKKIESPSPQREHISACFLESLLFLCTAPSMGIAPISGHWCCAVFQALRLVAKKQPLQQSAQERVRRKRFCRTLPICPRSLLCSCSALPLQSCPQLLSPLAFCSCRTLKTLKRHRRGCC